MSNHEKHLRARINICKINLESDINYPLFESAVLAYRDLVLCMFLSYGSNLTPEEREETIAMSKHARVFLDQISLSLEQHYSKFGWMEIK